MVKAAQKSTPRKSTAPPKKEIRWDVVDFFLNAGGNGHQIASTLGIHYATLALRCENEKKMKFSEYSQIKKQEGHMKVLSKQFSKALQGDNTMLIWVGKQQLHQREDIKITATFDGKLANVLDALKNVNSELDFKKKDELLAPPVEFKQIEKAPNASNKQQG